MKAAIMQPYFFPYLGYFALIKHTDKFIVFDTVQYIRKGWINRNRILKPTEGWQYIIAPVKAHKRSAIINDIELIEGDDWKKKILAQVEHYRKKAPHFKDVISLLEECFSQNSINISNFNIFCLEQVCKYLEMPFNFKVFSEMNMNIIDVNAPDEWALKISEGLGASEYYNLPGGISFFSKEKYKSKGIELRFLELEPFTYSQKMNSDFESGLSIIDTLLFNSKDDVHNLLDKVVLK